MKKKFILLISIFIVIIAVFCTIDCVRDNYRLGREIYNVSTRLEIQCYDYAKSIDYLQQEYAKEGDSEGFITHSFENAMRTSLSYFGHENVPILDESRNAWGQRFEELFFMFANKPSEQYEIIFANQTNEITEFKNQMYSMAEKFGEFRDNYSQLSVWEQYFTSWKKQRIKLTDVIGLP